MPGIQLILAVALGGAIGSVARYLLVTVVQQHVTTFPLGTLAVNVIGCFVIGICYIWFAQRSVSTEAKTLIQVGILGGFTTFSSFTIETAALMEKDLYGLAALNVVGSVVIGLVAAFAGIALARALLVG